MDPATNVREKIVAARGGILGQELNYHPQQSQMNINWEMNWDMILSMDTSVSAQPPPGSWFSFTATGVALREFDILWFVFSAALTATVIVTILANENETKLIFESGSFSPHTQTRSHRTAPLIGNDKTGRTGVRLLKFDDLKCVFDVNNDGIVFDNEINIFECDCNEKFYDNGDSNAYYASSGAFVFDIFIFLFYDAQNICTSTNHNNHNNNTNKNSNIVI